MTMMDTAQQCLARPVQATTRDTDWLESGSGAFHDTITSRPCSGCPCLMTS